MRRTLANLVVCAALAAQVVAVAMCSVDDPAAAGWSFAVAVVLALVAGILAGRRNA